MRKFTAPAVLILALAVTPGRADEGSIPIYGQIIIPITAPGHYIVTRDFSYLSGYGIDIQASDVTLDLNGRTITGPACGSGEVAIHIATSSATQGIVIRNGRLVSGCSGIVSDTTNRLRVRIEDVEVAGPGVTGVFISAAEVVEVLRCHIHDIPGVVGNGIGIYGSTGAFTGRISENVVERVGKDAIVISGMAAGEVRRNVVVDYGLGGGLRNGIILLADSLAWGAGSNLVEGNTIRAEQGDTECDGIRANTTSPFNVLANNVVSGAGRIGINSSSEGTRIERNTVTHSGANGIESDGEGAYIEGNVVSSNGSYGILSTGAGTRIERNLANRNGSHGIRLGSASATTNNHLEENQTQSNGTGGSGCGIFFFPVTSGNVIRNNNVLGNPTAVASCNWTGNIDGGGNIQ
jgi:hypothetical protein